MVQPFPTVAVAGAGTMGQGIALSILLSGRSVQWLDAQPDAIRRGKQYVVHHATALRDKQRITLAQFEWVNHQLHTVPEARQVTADLVIEAIVEDLNSKQQLIRDLPGHSILASNTSALSITTLAESAGDRTRVAGLHFFNPAHLMRLVEVVETPYTAPAVREALVAFVKSLGKTAVVVKDSPGFIVNRVARLFYTESFAMLDRLTPEQLDNAMRNAGFRMGPCELADLIGHDVNLAVTTSLYQAFGRAARFAPSPVQQALVSEGNLGKKTKKGFYEYP